VPRLGTEYAWNEDGTELSITLREGVEWSDGEAFTADDVKFTFDMVAAGEVPNTTGFAGTTEVVDPTHVTVSFKEPSYMNGPSSSARSGSCRSTSGAPSRTRRRTRSPTPSAPARTRWAISSRSPSPSPPMPPTGTAPRRRPVRRSGRRLLRPRARHRPCRGELPRLQGGHRAHEPDGPGHLRHADLGCEAPQTDPAVRQAISYAMDRTQLNELAFQNVASETSPGFALPERDAAYLSDERRRIHARARGRRLLREGC
jgi:peptide/nickel transport system substrate-binding protein